MEPQPFGHGNVRQWLPRPNLLPAFNGATAFRPWKLVANKHRGLSSAILQWSHSLSAMETAQVESEYSELWVLQWSHSLSAMETGPMGRVGQHGLRAFNGATASRPWKLALPHPTDDWHLRLQWSHSLSAMETLASSSINQRVNEPSMEPQPFGHGNDGNDNRHQHANAPSMEPQPFGHGNIKLAANNPSTTYPSMEPQPFGHGNGGMAGHRSPSRHSFNGATAFRPWKRECARTRAGCTPTLQWSHSLSAMETRRREAGGRQYPVPSMEPQPFGHGNPQPEDLNQAAFLPSMEPQPFGHGNAGDQTCDQDDPKPSMEPQPFGHGNYAELSRSEQKVRLPSMEPQPFGHGN